MAGIDRDPQGTFWIWGTLLAVVLSIAVAWLSAHDGSADHAQASPPIESQPAP